MAFRDRIILIQVRLHPTKTHLTGRVLHNFTRPVYFLPPASELLFTRSGSSTLISADLSVGPFDAPAQRSPDLPPPSVSQYSTSKNTVTNLQMERRMLQPRLSFLQKHLVLHKLHIRHARRTEETKRITNSYRERLGLIGERRESLVAAHSASVRGSYAKEYRKLLAKHVRLEDQFRQAVSSRVVALYALQKLIIDVVYSHTTGRPWMVCVFGLISDIARSMN